MLQVFSLDPCCSCCCTLSDTIRFLCIQLKCKFHFHPPRVISFPTFQFSALAPPPTNPNPSPNQVFPSVLEVSTGSRPFTRDGGINLQIPKGWLIRGRACAHSHNQGLSHFPFRLRCILSRSSSTLPTRHRTKISVTVRLLSPPKKQLYLLIFSHHYKFFLSHNFYIIIIHRYFFSYTEV